MLYLEDVRSVYTSPIRVTCPFFCPIFDPNREKIWPERPLNLVFLAITDMNSTQMVLQSLTLALKGIPLVKYEEKKLFLYFFDTIGHNCPKTTRFDFFSGFQ